MLLSVPECPADAEGVNLPSVSGWMSGPAVGCRRPQAAYYRGLSFRFRTVISLGGLAGVTPRTHSVVCVDAGPLHPHWLLKAGARAVACSAECNVQVV